MAPAYWGGREVSMGKIRVMVAMGATGARDLPWIRGSRVRSHLLHCFDAPKSSGGARLL